MAGLTCGSGGTCVDHGISQRRWIKAARGYRRKRPSLKSTLFLYSTLATPPIHFALILMATVHSLPTELIQHTLSLAYPPGEDESYHGLARTALVHSSWLSPSQSVMTEVLQFDSGTKWSLKLFVEGGPSPFSSQRVALSSCEEVDAYCLLSKARSGVIKHLSFQVTPKCKLARIFNFASLNSKLEHDPA